MKAYVELAANAATVIVALSVVLLLGQQYLERRQGPGGQPYVIGEHLDIDFAKAERTLLLVVQQNCAFCAASMPFYRTLIEEREVVGADVQFVVLAPERDAGIAEYLASNQIAADQVLRVNPEDLPGVSGTPTLLLADSRRMVTAAWRGELTDGEQGEVVEALFGRNGTIR